MIIIFVLLKLENLAKPSVKFEFFESYVVKVTYSVLELMPKFLTSKSRRCTKINRLRNTAGASTDTGSGIPVPQHETCLLNSVYKQALKYVCENTIALNSLYVI
jgi:hypothetical protein